MALKVYITNRRICAVAWRAELTRHTGKNTAKLLTEIDRADGECTWTYSNAGALSLIRSSAERPPEPNYRRIADRIDDYDRDDLDESPGY